MDCAQIVFILEMKMQIKKELDIEIIFKESEYIYMNKILLIQDRIGTMKISTYHMHTVSYHQIAIMCFNLILFTDQNSALKLCRRSLSLYNSSNLNVRFSRALTPEKHKFMKRT